MSELREASNSAQENRNLTDLFRSCLTCAVVSVDHHEQITGFNDAAEKLTGLDAARLFNQPSSHLPPPLRDAIRDTLRSAVPVTGREVTLQHPDRGEIPVRITTEPIRQSNPGKACAGVMAIVNELPAAQELEVHMRQLDRLASIGTLSASMAHEIKNALVPVRTFIELLLEKQKEDELSGLVGREINRVDSIVSQMLRFAGPAKPTFAAVSAHEILQLAVNLTRRQIERRNVTLTTVFEADRDRVNGDTYQLQAAFMNLLFNALEAVTENGRITIATDLLEPAATAASEVPSTMIRLRFMDSGAGIPADIIGRLFEPFFTTKADGTGLGLNITQRIVREHRGSIHVESQPGNGATFTLLLPCLPASGATGAH